MVKHLLSLADFSVQELEEVVLLAQELKVEKDKDQCKLYGKTLAMYFEKPSTRTRISFEVAMAQLGGYPLVLRPAEMQLGRGETIADSARVFSRYVDVLMGRVYKHETLTEMADHASIPIINGLSEVEHPCQIVADLLTVKEAFGKLKGVKMAYVGDGNNVCNSLMLGCAMMGVKLAVATPKGYEPDSEILKQALDISPSSITLSTNPKKAVEDAEVIYTDVWVSMGDEKEEEQRKKVFLPYQVNQVLLEEAKPGVKVLHCLPAHRGLEITDEVIDSDAALVWDQAENRLHAQKAILLKLLS